MINCSRLFLILWLTSSVAAEAVNICSVHPTAEVVVVGERVSLHCTASGGSSIKSWQIGSDISNNTVVYTAPIFGPNRTVRTNEYVADGYYVTNSSGKNISLHIDDVTLSRAGLYVCQCDDEKLSAATTAVVVLASEPNISVSFNANGWKTFNVNCTILFKGSKDVLSELTIKNISGSIVSRTVCLPNNGLTSCNLTQTIIADTSADQLFSCSVHLNRNNSTIYSRTVKASLEWQLVSSAEIVVTNPGKCFADQCAIGQTIMCKTNGHPGITVFKWWQNLNNGNESRTIGNGSQFLVLNEAGRFTYQCQAYNVIRGVTYNSTSKPFTTDVTNNKRDGELPMLFVIAISVAIGVIVIVITVVVICISRSRKQKNKSFQSLSTHESSDIPQRPPAARYDKTKMQNRGQQGVAPTASNRPAVSGDNRPSTGNDLLVLDNELYEGARYQPSKSVDPSDGYTADAVIYNEIGEIG